MTHTKFTHSCNDLKGQRSRSQIRSSFREKKISRSNDLSYHNLLLRLVSTLRDFGDFAVLALVRRITSEPSSHDLGLLQGLRSGWTQQAPVHAVLAACTHKLPMLRYVPMVFIFYSRYKTHFLDRHFLVLLAYSARSTGRVSDCRNY